MTFLRKAVNKWNEMKHLFLGQTKIKTRNVVIAKLRKNYLLFHRMFRNLNYFKEVLNIYIKYPCQNKSQYCMK